MKRLKSGSERHELLTKSREAALSAVQIFNNPQISFKSETFIVLNVIAWTYLLHAYYKGKGIDYRYFRIDGRKKKYYLTPEGSYKYWELSQCLKDLNCPLDTSIVNNLKFLIGIRNEIEHRMTKRIDSLISARFQASCINYNTVIKTLFGEDWGLDKHISISLQMAGFGSDQVKQIRQFEGVPEGIIKFIEGFDGSLSESEFNDPKFAYRVFFVARAANRKGQADSVIEFVKQSEHLEQEIDKILVKETEKRKYRPGQVVAIMRSEGFVKFRIKDNTDLWQSLNAKVASSGFGVDVAGDWYWYDSWVERVREYCKDNCDKYR